MFCFISCAVSGLNIIIEQLGCLTQQWTTLSLKRWVSSKYVEHFTILYVLLRLKSHLLYVAMFYCITRVFMAYFFFPTVFNMYQDGKSLKNVLLCLCNLHKLNYLRIFFIIADKLTPLINKVQINKNSVESQVKIILSNCSVSDPEQFNYWLLKAITLIDLTTLAGDDTRSNVLRLCSLVSWCNSHFWANIWQ